MFLCPSQLWESLFQSKERQQKRPIRDDAGFLLVPVGMGAESAGLEGKPLCPFAVLKNDIPFRYVSDDRPMPPSPADKDNRSGMFRFEMLPDRRKSGSLVYVSPRGERPLDCQIDTFMFYQPLPGRFRSTIELRGFRPSIYRLWENAIFSQMPDEKAHQGI